MIMNEDEYCQEEEDKDNLIVIVALAVLGKPIPIQSLQTYLTCQDLAGHPCTSSAWTHLQSIGNDCAFVTVMGIDVATFE
jgi:hypothetical protein